MTNPNAHLSDGELLAMTDQLDQMHRDQGLPALRVAVGEWIESLRESRSGRPADELRRPSRRTFLLGGAGLGGAGLVLAACSSSSKSSSSSTTPASSGTSGSGSSPTSAGGAGLTGDLAVAAMAASLENLAVYAYGAGIKAATAGKLGSVPPAVVTFAQTAMSQHQDHAKAWNSALTAAGKPAVSTTDPALTPTVNAAFGKVTNVTQLAQLALLLENTAAQTYQNGIGVLSAKSSIGVAASIQPVEMQHAAILYYVLGQYPGIQGSASNMFASGTPLAFNPTTLARSPSDYTS